MQRPRTYAVALAAFVAVDFVWLGFVSPPLYQATIGDLLLPSPNIPAAIAFYLLYIVGIVEFVVLPARPEAPLRATFGRGALFGLIAYATFDLTALAVLKGWSTLITVIDLAWGAVLTGSVAAITRRFTRRPAAVPDPGAR